MNEPTLESPLHLEVERRYDGSALPFAFAAVIFVFMAFGGWKWWQVRQFETSRAVGVPVSIAPLPLDSFELDERGGQPFRSAEMRGRVWVVSYFFASCIGPCRILNGNIQELTSYPDLADATFVSITCDPDNDTVDVLKQYAELYHADPKRWLFCRSDLDYLKRVARGMNLALFLKTHSDHMVVIDRAGTIRGMFDGTSKYQCQQLRTLLHECLAEQPPKKETAVEDTTAPPTTSATSAAPLYDPTVECCDDDPALLQQTQPALPVQPANRSGV